MVDDQFDFFGQLDLFGNVPEPPKAPAVKMQSASCSANGLVNFKYNPLMKRSIRCSAIWK